MLNLRSFEFFYLKMNWTFLKVLQSVIRSDWTVDDLDCKFDDKCVLIYKSDYLEMLQTIEWQRFFSRFLIICFHNS